MQFNKNPGKYAGPMEESVYGEKSGLQVNKQNIDTPKPNNSITTRVETIGKSITELNEMLYMLHDRIGPVLRAVEDTNVKESVLALAPVTCDLDSRLYHIEEAIGGIKYNMGCLINRVEI